MCDQGHDDILAELKVLETRVEDVEVCLTKSNGTLDEIASATETIRKCIIGLDEIADKTEKIRKCIIGDLDDTPGLAERVRNLEKWVENQKWTVRLIVTVFVTQIIGWIFVLLQR